MEFAYPVERVFEALTKHFLHKTSPKKGMYWVCPTPRTVLDDDDDDGPAQGMYNLGTLKIAGPVSLSKEVTNLRAITNHLRLRNDQIKFCGV